MRRFHLYRHYDAAGDLLYVGQSSNAFERFSEHRNDSDWAVASVTMRVELFDSREAVLAAERRAIIAENPRFNRLRPTGPGAIVMVRLQPDEAAAIDAWRRRQDDLPGRPEALRRLAKEALSAPQKKR